MNRLKAQITSIQSSEHLSFVGVEANGELLHLLLLEKPLEAIGDEVNLVFKESEVILSKDVIKSTANMSKGIISEIQKGEILTHVTLLHNDIEIASLVPTQTFDMMKCNLGDTIYWIISPSEISLQRSHYGK
ncbi:TOBE domain protein [Sulfurovum sp. enrichment culture clone C5]|uniref:TOBE domain protein n=1 Tax=Sulfurovum sp. enrichment culture clone C5 TaxID=497650 RepID=A0A0S4XPD8_9BACT|nr:TOBE domain protein [Sulfurovum sp. enrichment culture clone C5]